ncbi:MAG: radical SAM protein [Candidatus Nealsonbacteria bacterium]|nr:radical SAM protein [Candidatus Nealsonbacteria bacterium]
MKNKIILIYPGPLGLYLKGELLSVILDNPLSKRFFSYVLNRKVTLPLSILCLVPYLKNAGFKIALIDGRVEDSLARLKEELSDEVLYVGISALTGNMIHYGLFCAEYVRNYNSSIPIVWGGVHVTIATQESMSTSELIDIAVRGEGEITAVELAKVLQNNGNLSEVLGISFKKDGEIYHNPDRLFMDFDTQLEIEYDALPLNRYDITDTLLYQSERGCPHRCAFCDVVIVHRGKFRQKKAETVLRDFERIHTTLSPRRIQLVDDCFFTDLKRAKVIIDGLIDLNLGIQWHASCRAQYFRKTDVEFWKLAKKSRLDDLYVGGESGSQRTLDYIKKDCTVEDILNAARQANEAGIELWTNFMCGFPEETVEDIGKTIGLIDFLNITYKDKMRIGAIFLYAPCPGTPMHQKVVEAGYVPPKTFAEWGRFIIGDRSHTCWHPFINYISAVSLCSKWGRKFDLKKSLGRLRRFNLPGILMDVLGHIAYLRWKNKKFSYSYDLKVLRAINRFFYKE